MIKEFDKYNIQFVRQFVQDALDEVGKKMDISFELKKITYGPDYFRCNLESNIGSKDNARVIRWNRDCSKYNLLPEHLGKQFIYDGCSYVTWDINKKKRKYPILAREIKSRKLVAFAADAFRNVTLIGELG